MPALLSSVFGSHMVLQADAPFELFGHAPQSAIVSYVLETADGAPPGVIADGTATTDGNMDWRASLPALPAGGPFNLTVSATLDGLPSGYQQLTDVHLGLVVFCSGQSNLDGATTPLSYVFNATEEVAETAYYPNVRIFTVGTYGNGSYTPLIDLAYPPKIPWAVASADSSVTAGFSATCWLTGKNLANALGNGTAIGLVESAWSGTSIQVWLPPTGVPCPTPYPPIFNCGAGCPSVPSCLYNAMVNPFLGLKYAAFTFYQGESNALTMEAGFYDCALPSLISTWRGLFGVEGSTGSGSGSGSGSWWGEVQIAPWAGSADDSVPTAQLRASQQRIMSSLPNITVASAADLGDPKAPKTSIHPRGKAPIGQRLAAGALQAMYGPGAGPGLLYATGPVYASAVSGGAADGSLSATVSFAPSSLGPEGLTLVQSSTTGPYANSSVCPDSVPADVCSGYQVQDEAGSWHAAVPSLTPDGLRLLLTVPGVTGMTANATSSGWALWPVLQLYNEVGVPAYPWLEAVGPAAEEAA